MPIEVFGIIVVAVSLFGFVLTRLYYTRQELKTLKERFRTVIDAEKEANIIRETAEKEVKETRATRDRIQNEIEDLRTSYKEKRSVYDNLLKEISIYEEHKSLLDVGVYERHFDFTDSDQFKEQIKKIRESQKAMVSTLKNAVLSFKTWTVGDSKSEGKKMINRAIRLSLRAFNNECEAALSNVRWNNVTTMENRIYKAYEQINKLNETIEIEINHDYLELKLKELFATHEYREKQKEERDHKAEMARSEREEKKLLEDAAKAEKEEAKYQKLLDQARKEIQKAAGKDVEEYEAKIAELTKELEKAHEKTERAKSMAQQTQKGYIYVVSNIGSFGEGVYKIGMTRRLEPMDRVKELGDASVPFRFDAHAMVYCENAPTVEKTLHEVFNQHRINLANHRKEFFRVSLDDIKKELCKFVPDADIVTDVEAQEYHETLAMMEGSKGQNSTDKALDAFPVEI